MTLSKKFREEGIAIGEVKSLIKTTTALNLGYALSEKGIKVLLIGFDPQSSLTLALGYDAENKENIQILMTLAIE